MTRFRMNKAAWAAAGIFTVGRRHRPHRPAAARVAAEPQTVASTVASTINATSAGAAAMRRFRS